MWCLPVRHVACSTPATAAGTACARASASRFAPTLELALALPHPTASLTCGSIGEQDSILQNRINENTDRMSEIMASSTIGSRAGSRLGNSRSRPGSSTSNRPQSAMSSSAKGFDHRVQSGRPLSAMSQSANRQVSGGLGWSEPADDTRGDRGGGCEVWDDSDKTKEIFPKDQFGQSQYKKDFGLSATKWGGRRDQLHKQEPIGPSSFKPRLQFRPTSASSRQSRQPDEMSQCSERSVGSQKGVPKARVDVLLRQLRLLCYRKVKGNGSDVSVREVFRHFDSNKDEDEDGAGIDAHEFYSALTKLMLGTAEDGLVTEEEAEMMFKQIDVNAGGTIDYREVAQMLSQPGWDSRLVGRLSNVLL
jgi:hypothetical protein